MYSCWRVCVIFFFFFFFGISVSEKKRYRFVADQASGVPEVDKVKRVPLVSLQRIDIGNQSIAAVIKIFAIRFTFRTFWTIRSLCRSFLDFLFFFSSAPDHIKNASSIFECVRLSCLALFAAGRYGQVHSERDSSHALPWSLSSIRLTKASLPCSVVALRRSLSKSGFPSMWHVFSVVQ